MAAALFSGLIASGSYEHVSHARHPNLIGVSCSSWPSPRSSDCTPHPPFGTSLPGYLRVLGGLLPYGGKPIQGSAARAGGNAVLAVPAPSQRKRGIALLSSFTLLGLLSVLYAWDTYDLPSLVAGPCGAGTGRGGEAVAMALGTKPTGELARLLATTSDRRVARAAGRAPRGGRSPAEANGAAANTGVPLPAPVGRADVHRQPYHYEQLSGSLLSAT